MQPKLPPVDADDVDSSDDDLSKTNTLENQMKEISIDPIHPRFFGKSSSVMFLHTAIALKHTYAEQEPTLGSGGRRKIAPSRRPEYWHAQSVSTLVALLYLMSMLTLSSGSLSPWRTPSHTPVSHLKTS